MTKTLYVGLDIHAETIAVAVAEEGRRGEIRFFGTIRNTSDSLQRLAKRLSEKGQNPVFCYEAGCCGYGIHRLLTKFGYECDVVSPSMIPRRPGDHIKTDRRDAEMLARLLRAGELTAIWTPNEEHEAMRASFVFANKRWTLSKSPNNSFPASFYGMDFGMTGQLVGQKAIGGGSMNCGGLTTLISRLLLRS